MIFITSYHSPDIDGVACCVGYLEYLKKLRKETSATYFGDLSKEVEFVKKYTGFFPLIKHSRRYPEDAEFILVDVADPDALEPEVSYAKVKEIYDHRELVFTEKFENAKLHIEKVGSCATLITELFKRNNLEPSPNAAVYLYSAIISNTVNFKNSVTTQRDIDAAGWLRPIAGVEKDYVEKMFEYKSKIRNASDLIFLIEQDFGTKETYGKNVGIAQVEIANLEEVIDLYRKDIRENIGKLKRKEKVDYILFSGIDIIKGFNLFIAFDSESDRFFSKVFGVRRIGDGYKTKEIIMRKQIRPKVEKILSITNQN